LQAGRGREREALDRTAMIVDQEDHRLQTISKDGGEFLTGELERPVANEEQMSTARRRE
jgi:hypothetical protein